MVLEMLADRTKSRVSGPESAEARVCVALPFQATLGGTKIWMERAVVIPLQATLSGMQTLIWSMLARFLPNLER
jgi:hypothetical protein